MTRLKETLRSLLKEFFARPRYFGSCWVVENSAGSSLDTLLLAVWQLLGPNTQMRPLFASLQSKLPPSFPILLFDRQQCPLSPPLACSADGCFDLPTSA